MSEHTVNTQPKQIHEMTDREIAEETLYWMRTAGQALHEMQKGGMARMMAGMFTGKNGTR